MNKKDINSIYIGDITYESEDQTLDFVKKCSGICYRTDSKLDRNEFLHKHSAHGSLFEHSQIVIRIENNDTKKELIRILFITGQYRFFELEFLYANLIGGNLRAWMETYDLLTNTDRHIRKDTIEEIFGPIKSAFPTFLNHWDVKAWGYPLINKDVPMPMRRYAAYIEANRSVLGQFTRHDMGFTVESSRYCNYAHDRFTNSVEFSSWNHLDGIPCKEDTKENREKAYSIWEEACLVSEKAYMDLAKLTKADYARSVLNFNLYTRWFVSAIPFYWKNFFKLRDANSAHADIRHISRTLHKQMDFI